MATIIDEMFDSRPGQDGDTRTCELRYVILNTDDDAEVRALVKATAPLYYLNMRRTEWVIMPEGGHPGKETWKATVYYEKPEESEYTFETGGGTRHISHSLATIQSIPATGFTAPNFRRGIGVNGDNIDGVDVVEPVFNFSEKHYIDADFVDLAYKRVIFNTTGRVNGGTFKGFPKGEVLFLGASGQKRGEDYWEILYKFAALPNVSGMNLGSGMSGINKEGWQYLWLRYLDDEDEFQIIRRPVAAYVEQVYQYADFAGLGIGVDEE